MDSLTQIVLGASVAEAALGRKVGNKAMLWGAIAGTIPDLDVLAKYFTDEITAIEMHRGFSHSLVFCLIAAPLFGWMATKFYKKREANFKAWTWMFFLSFVTHPILDAHTGWGTQFFWPFDLRIAFQNIFVVDPIYSVPFLICTLIALFFNRNNSKRRIFNNAGLIISSSYMLITFALKASSFSSFSRAIKKNEITHIGMETRPLPLNSILWNAQIETNEGFIMAYYSFFDNQAIQFSNVWCKNEHLIEPYKDQKVVQQLISITQNKYLIEETDDGFLMTDIRFGQSGFDGNNSPFIWKYKLTIGEEGQIKATRFASDFGDIDKALRELWLRIKGN